jgi:hypothetical protein
MEPISHIHTFGSVGKCEGMNSHTPNWAPTLGIGILMDFQIFKKWFLGSKLIILNSSLYHWKDLKCLKWARMTHLSSKHIDCGQMKGQESKCQYDSGPLKVGNRHNLLTCKWRVTYSWKAFNESYNFATGFTQLEAYIKSYGFPKLQESQLWKFWDSRLGRLGTKWHLGVIPMARHKEYCEGEGGGFLWIWIMMNFVSPCMPMVCSCTKKVLITH